MSTKFWAILASATYLIIERAVEVLATISKFIAESLAKMVDPLFSRPESIKI